MQILRQTHVLTPIRFAGGPASPAKPADDSASGSASGRDTFQKNASTEEAGEKALEEFEDRKRFYTNVLLNAVPKFLQKCEELKLNPQKEAEKAAEKRALKETKWPTFPDWEFNSDEKPEASSPS